jgi:FkbM family methyltransferase
VTRQEPYDLAWQLRRLFATLQINCVIDVGAHVGEFGSLVRRVGYDGRLVSFEPIRESYNALATAPAHDDGWQTYHAALGDAGGVATMTVFNLGVFNSLLRPTGYAAEQFGERGCPKGSEEVIVKTLDECLPEFVADLTPPRVFLKLDTQGYDQRVLDGGAHVLDDVVALQTEIPITHLYEDAPPFEESIRRLREHGFEPVGFFPIVNDREGLRVIEFDCVAVRSALLAR